MPRSRKIRRIRGVGWDAQQAKTRLALASDHSTAAAASSEPSSWSRGSVTARTRLLQDKSKRFQELHHARWQRKVYSPAQTRNYRPYSGTPLQERTTQTRQPCRPLTRRLPQMRRQNPSRCAHPAFCLWVWLSMVVNVARDLSRGRWNVASPPYFNGFQLVYGCEHQLHFPLHMSLMSDIGR